ncbi:DNA-binding transcriptional regulator GbsR, MarR family [Halobacillus dabanensis]|uniref:HTH-type transcriptional regulator n=1 Tax=Halobacillus dabanensis TaxID=240302 RepID=A0A1I3SYV5_HALDA|nr:helix-turn-helix domain-containing protein [Halobacillus dabanensis]SFJ63412.1 DNA-binding transcriptional regulator GbsR, MarR family [Halobacillus dabanensis]
MVTNDPHILETIHTKVTHEFSKTLEMFGLSPQDARLFVTLYLHQTPMTLDEMSEALGKSKTAMSNGVRALLDQGLVERVWKKGFRKDLYQANENLYRNFMSSYIKKWQEAAIEQKNSLNVMEEELKSRIQDYSDQEKMQLADDLYHRIEDMISFHEWIAQAFDGIDPER